MCLSNYKGRNLDLTTTLAVYLVAVKHVSISEVILAKMVIEQIHPPVADLTQMTAVLSYSSVNDRSPSFQTRDHFSFSFSVSRK